MKALLIAVVCVLVLWIFQLKTNSPSSGEIEKEEVIRRDDQKTLRNDKRDIDPHQEWLRLAEILQKDEDPFPNESIDTAEFSRRYKELLADKSLVLRDRKMGLEMLTKSFVLKPGIRYALENLPEYFGSGAIRNKLYASLFQ